MYWKTLLFVLLFCACSSRFSPEDGGGETADVLDPPEGEDDEIVGDPDIEPVDFVGDTGEVPDDPVEEDKAEEEEVDVDPCTLYPTWYRDFDMDGYGRDDDTVCAPEAPTTYVDRGGDCCDGNVDVRPDQTGWFVEPYSCPTESFDYNCDGTAEQEHTLVGCGDTYCDGYTPESVCESQPGCWEGRTTALPCGESALCVGCSWSHLYTECRFPGACPSRHGIISPYTMACR